MPEFSIGPIQKGMTAKEAAYRQLKNAILHGTIDKEFILTELNLSEILQISRTPVRAVLSDLAKEGLLIHIPQKGYKIRKITRKEIEQITFLRTAIECEGVKRLAPVVTDKQLKRLSALLRKQLKVIDNNDIITFTELDCAFHTQLLDDTDQNILKKAFLDSYNLARLVGYHALLSQDRMTEVISEHREILNALTERNSARAMEFMKQHLQKTQMKADVK